MVSREVWSACTESRLETTGLYPTSERPRDRGGAMRRPPGIAARAGGASPRSASAVLGSDHPLARATEALDSVVRQSRAVAAVLVGSSIDLMAGRAWAATLAASATIVLLILTADRRGMQTDPTRPRARAHSRGARERPSRRRPAPAPTPPGPADANDPGPKPRGPDRTIVSLAVDSQPAGSLRCSNVLSSGRSRTIFARSSDCSAATTHRCVASRSSSTYSQTPSRHCTEPK